VILGREHPRQGIGGSVDKWTLQELQEHIKINTDYSSAVVVAALYKKLYGYFPKIGLSGFQGEAAQHVFESLPDYDIYNTPDKV